MKRFVQGEDRSQVTLLPECLDDYIAEDNPVRVVDAFVEELDLQALGLEGVEPAETGRPSYHPSLLLKIYIYGYLNRVQSSRRLERECHRNVELLWLTGRLAPDFGNACRQFVMICWQLKLLTQASVAIDGSKFKAVNDRDRNFTPHKLEQRMRQVEDSIERYLGALDTADRTQPVDLEIKTARLNEKLGSSGSKCSSFERSRASCRINPTSNCRWEKSVAISKGGAGQTTSARSPKMRAATSHAGDAIPRIPSW